MPAVRVAAMLAPETLHGRLNALGLALPRSAGWYGASLALGSADVSLLALANAYRGLANGGVVTAPALRPGAPKRRVRALDPGAAHLVSDILADNNARALTFGLDSALATRGWAAVKTGTSKDMRDNWCVGFTDRYTIGVWVGNASGAAMHGVSGVSGAAPIWQALARSLHAGMPSKPPAIPAGVRPATLAAAEREAARSELFLVGSEPRGGGAMAPAPVERRFGIVHPRDGSVFAIDPDIPPAAQRITFEGEPGLWVLDGRPLGEAERRRWAPWPGRHRLTLLGRDRRPLQTVRFEVRGAGVRASAPR